MGVNFTPKRGRYDQLKPFRFWCQTALPLVYDDSLSYYELLCKFVDYINGLINDNKKVAEDITTLQEYVDNYFNTLDIQKEIDDKLDEMAESGELADIFAEAIRVVLSPSIGDKFLFVSKQSGFAHFTVVNDAVDFAKQYCTPSQRVSIVIINGTYDESINLHPNPGIDIFGIGEVRIENDAAYPEAPLYTAGRGKFSNIHFKGTNSYACHVEHYGLEGRFNTGELRFENCIFETVTNESGTYYHGFGAGLGEGVRLILDNCTMRGTTNHAACYIHNSPANNVPNQEFIMNNCTLISTYIGLIIHDACSMQGHSNSSLFCTFKNNEIYPGSNRKFQFNESTNEALRYIPVHNTNIGLRDCFGNNCESLNYKPQIVSLDGMFTNIASYYKQAIVNTAPFSSESWNIEPGEVQVQGVGNETVDTETARYDHCNYTFRVSAGNQTQGAVRLPATMYPNGN